MTSRLGHCYPDSVQPTHHNGVPMKRLAPFRVQFCLPVSAVIPVAAVMHIYCLAVRTLCRCIYHTCGFTVVGAFRPFAQAHRRFPPLTPDQRSCRTAEGVRLSTPYRFYCVGSRCGALSRAAQTGRKHKGKSAAACHSRATALVKSPPHQSPARFSARSNAVYRAGADR